MDCAEARKRTRDVVRQTPSDVARSAPVILMVSGGADSMALLHMAATNWLTLADGVGSARCNKSAFHVLHVNHLPRQMQTLTSTLFKQLATR